MKKSKSIWKLNQQKQAKAHAIEETKQGLYFIGSLACLFYTFIYLF